jgi:hypothetical protein
VESVLAAINLWFGVALSLIGSVTVAPQAVPELWKVARDDAHEIRGFLAKFLPFLRRSATVQAATVSVTATVPVAFAAHAAGRAVDMSSVEAQLAALWKEVDSVRSEV